MMVMHARTEKERQVELFWDSSPCDSKRSAMTPNSVDYFLEIERDRYQYQLHIPRLLDTIRWRGKRVLEIGTGVGTDARQMIARGAAYTGVNIDRGSTELTKSALARFGLPGVVQQADATALPFASKSFDAVYSYGVLHHIPNVQQAVSEIYRVLKPGGEILVMVYNRSSINYYIEIMLLRRIFVRLLTVPGVVNALVAMGLPRETLDRHRQLHKTHGSMDKAEWLSRNTDGPDNPYSRVYSHSEIERELFMFEIIRNQVYFFDHRHWGPIGRALPSRIRYALGRMWGWHRVVHGRKPAVKNIATLMQRETGVEGGAQ